MTHNDTKHMDKFLRSVVDPRSHQRGEAVAIEAPTGSGKTTGMLRLTARCRSSFGKTLFIFPTRIAAVSAVASTFPEKRAAAAPVGDVDGNDTTTDHARSPCPHIITAAPRNAIQHLVGRSASSFGTIIMDEAHHTSTEYIAILDILAKRWADQRAHPLSSPGCRLFFLSATLHRERLVELFPAIRIMSIPVSTPFPIEIRYLDIMPWHQIPSMKKLSETVRRIVGQIVTGSAGGAEPGPVTTGVAHKMLVFVATHNQCELLRTDLLVPFTYARPMVGGGSCTVDLVKDGYTIVTLHGGKPEDEFEEAKRTILHGRKTICICTNIAETAVTLPDTDTIIDSGVRCSTFMGNTVMENPCDQMSMIQRAGRTGRTCPGTVYRLMTRARFEDTPFQDIPDLCYDAVVLQLFLVDADPVSFLGEKAEESIDRFLQQGVLATRTSRPEKTLVRFLDGCGLEIHNGLLLHRFWATLTRHGAEGAAPSTLFTILVILGIVIINSFDIKPVHVLYIPPNSEHTTVDALRIALLDAFGTDHDYLMLLMRVFMAVFGNENPKEVAARYSLNFRVLRDWRKTLLRIYRFLYGRTETGNPPKNLVLIELFTSADGTDPLGPGSPLVEGIRSFLMRHSRSYDVEPVYYEWTEFGHYMGNNSHIDYRALTRFHRRIRLRSKYKHDALRTDKHFFIPLSKNTSTEQTTLWTMAPHDIREDVRGLRSAVHRARCHLDDRQFWRGMYDDVVSEIANEVAYRPGMYRMEIARDHFYSYLDD